MWWVLLALRLLPSFRDRWCKTRLEMLCAAGERSMLRQCGWPFHRIVFFVGWVFFVLSFLAFAVLLFIFANDDEVSRVVGLFVGMVGSLGASIYGWRFFSHEYVAPVTPEQQ